MGWSWMVDALEWTTPSLKGRTPPRLEYTWDVRHIMEEVEAAAAAVEDANETLIMTVAMTDTTDMTSMTTVEGVLRHRTTAAIGPVHDRALTAPDDTEAVMNLIEWRSICLDVRTLKEAITYLNLQTYKNNSGLKEQL